MSNRDARPAVGAPFAAPTGSTRLGAVVGDPVRHSLSPTIYNAAFAELGLDWVFVAFDVEDGRADEVLDAVRILDLGWLSVTMPHKRAVAERVDRASDDAKALDAVNCVINDNGVLVGENTDGEGFLAALEVETGFTAAGHSCAVLGAGGAARAVVRALALAGADEIVIVNRTRANADHVAQLALGVGRVGVVGDILRADLIVNATPVGMGDDPGLPLDPELLDPRQVLADLIYEPSVTPLLAAARGRGLTVVNGLGMLVHQAARQFELVTGQSAPLGTMSAAARAQLAG